MKNDQKLEMVGILLGLRVRNGWEHGGVIDEEERDTKLEP